MGNMKNEPWDNFCHKVHKCAMNDEHVSEEHGRGSENKFDIKMTNDGDALNKTDP